MHFPAYRNQTVQGKATGGAIAARWARHEEDVRALLAVALVNGVAIPAMSERQAAKVVNVSRHKIRLARLASVDDAALVKMGRLRLAGRSPHVRQDASDRRRRDRKLYQSRRPGSRSRLSRYDDHADLLDRRRVTHGGQRLEDGLVAYNETLAAAYKAIEAAKNAVDVAIDDLEAARDAARRSSRHAGSDEQLQ